VSQVIGAELRFEAIGCVAERCGHHSRIGDDHVEGLTFGPQVIGASAYAFQIGKIEFNQFEASAMGRGVFAHLLCSSFGLVQIPCCTYNVSAVSGKRTRSFNSKSCRNARDQNAFACQIDAGQNVICRRACSK
jgi:hypothetical protein